MSASSGWLAKVLGAPNVDRSGTQRATTTLVVIALSLFAWWMSLSGIHERNIGDYGLIHALPIPFFVALLVLTVGFAAALNERKPAVMPLVLYTITLIVMLRAMPALVFDEARYSWVYKHMGLTDYIRLHGTVNPLIDAYHNWPGFFAVSALFTDAAGLASPEQYAEWAQLFFNLLYVAPLVLIFRALTSDQRLVWGGVWLFQFVNWVGQDYFAPQALAFFFFLVVIAVALNSLRTPRLRPALGAYDLPRDPSQPGHTKRGLLKRQFGASVLLLVVFAALAPSHQLTPFMTISAVTALILFGQLRVKTLPLWLIIITFAWNFTFARTFMEGHSDWYANIGDLATNLRSAVDRPAAPTVVGRSTVLLLTQVFTLTVWGLAFLGGIRQLLQRRWSWAAVLLAAAPFPIILAQSYGGEIMLRIYLFSSPFMAFLAAAFIFPSEKVRSNLLTFTLTLTISAVFAVGFLLAHFGNEKVNLVSSAEVDTSRYLYRELPRGSAIAFVTHNFPEKIAGYYDQYSSYSLVKDFKLAEKVREGFEVNELVGFLRDTDAPSFVVFSQGDVEYAESFGQLPVGAATDVEEALRESGVFRLIYRTPDSRVYALRNTGGQR